MHCHGVVIVLIASCGISLSGCSERDIEKSTVPYRDAMKAKQDGDIPRALELLAQSIETQPTAWAYYDRAQIYIDQEKDDLAKADVTAGLKVDPLHDGLRWLDRELAKSAAQRFKGRNATPPSVVK